MSLKKNNLKYYLIRKVLETKNLDEVNEINKRM